MLALYVIPFCWALIVTIRLVRSPIYKIPGPWISKFTSLYFKFQEFKGNRRLFIHELHQRYGPVVCLAPNELSFVSLEAMKEIYSSGGSGYDKTEFYDLFQQYGHRTMFSTLNKDDHSQMKRRFADRYAMTNVMRPNMLKGIEEHAHSVVEKCSNSEGHSVDVYVLLHCYALDCVTHFMFSPGGTDSINDKEDLQLMKELSYDNSLQWRLLQYYAPTVSDLIGHLFPRKNFTRSKNYVLDVTSQEHPSQNTLVEKLQSKLPEVEQIQIAAECMDHMAAGIDTTGDGLIFLMWQLSQPDTLDVQKRLHEELCANPTTALDDLPYLNAVIKEGLRCFPPIPMSLPRYVPAGGRNIDGFQVPAGTIVSCQAWSMGRYDELIFPQPERFWPERWLEEEGMLERNRLFFSFAFGGRGCIGKNLAMIEMKVLVREIYLKLRSNVAPDMKGDMRMDDQIISTRPVDQVCLLTFEAY